MKLILKIIFFTTVFFGVFFACQNEIKNENQIIKKDTTHLCQVQLSNDELWQAPDTSEIKDDEEGKAIKYGKQLVLNTAFYIGPNGIVGKYTGNFMNCTNCHLKAGTVLYGFNFSSTHARYPQYRSRENKILSLAQRVNNCIERPHIGKPLPIESKEMTAIICYIKWVGQNSKVNQHIKGDSPIELEFPDVAADPLNGEKIYKRECQSCHGPDGEGKIRKDNVCYEYPPLWGLKSYPPGSSIHRLVKAATFIYCNMPYEKATYNKPVLTREEAFDVAAFINDDRIHKRPQNKGTINYPNIRTKPIDYGFGPYIDTFPEVQHKFGPFKPIVEWRIKRGLPTKF
ncbi:MAG: c-type cytochrome [Bacteroidota bacterium]|nr:c-type cytochrome [Bacteroidota bacterium]MDP3143773.1 c-type cytochrome [Bacteroidota bacterium]